MGTEHATIPYKISSTWCSYGIQECLELVAGSWEPAARVVACFAAVVYPPPRFIEVAERHTEDWASA